MADLALRAAERAYSVEPSEGHREAVRRARERGGLPLRFRDLAVGEPFEWLGGHDGAVRVVQYPGAFDGKPCCAVYPQPTEDWEHDNRYPVDPDRLVRPIPPFVC